MKFSEIPKMTREGNYKVSQSWDSIEDWIERERGEMKLDLNPDFQRGHVWNEEKQRNYVEFCLRGGSGSSELRFNCGGWLNSFCGPFVIVDGKQRLEAVRKFMRNELKAFGLYLNEFEGEFPWGDYDFIIHVNDLKTRKEVLQWYLDINTGGIVHTNEEIDRVKILLEGENNAL